VLFDKTAALNIISRSADRKNTAYLSLIFDFGNGTIIGRTRFKVLPTSRNVLFNINISQTMNNLAKLYISNNVGKKHEVDIFSILIKTKS